MTYAENERQSSFELLRLIAQLMIVTYHILLYYTYECYPDASLIYKSIQIPLHTAVILYVLISGYFGIKPSLRGGIKFLSIVLVYTISLLLLKFYICGAAENGKELLKLPFFISCSPFWFVRSYFCLYLISPLLNEFLNNATSKRVYYIVLALCFISIWIGSSHEDPTLRDGKNLANFMLIYCIGNMINKLRAKWYNISMKKLFSIVFLFNLILVSFHFFFASNLLGEIVWRMAFPYCSPLIFINSVLIFLIFAKLNFYCNLINKFAKSALAIYLIHGSYVVFFLLIKDVANYYWQISYGSPYMFIPLTLLTSIIICLICIAIDYILSPVWKSVDKIALKFDKLYNKIETNYIKK